jgi:hypothetical protein
MEGKCQGCLPANSDDVVYQAAKTKAVEQSEKNKEAVAIYKEGGEYKILNAFTAYANGYGPVIREVVSTYHGAATT